VKLHEGFHCPFYLDTVEILRIILACLEEQIACPHRDKSIVVRNFEWNRNIAISAKRVKMVGYLRKKQTLYLLKQTE
jgi:hypothetical protein